MQQKTGGHSFAKNKKVLAMKAAWMLQNGIIPCEIRNTPTHKYSVRKEDALAYIARSEHEKRSEIPVDIFNAKKTNNPRRTESQDSDCGGYFDDTILKLRDKERASERRLLRGGSHKASIVRSIKRKRLHRKGVLGV